MNDGVKILLERMETNPEEFVGRGKRWDYILEEYDNVLAEDEIKAINEGLRKLRRSELTRAVMQEILREPSPVEVTPSTYTIKTAGRFKQVDLLRQQADETYLKAQIEKNRGIK